MKTSPKRYSFDEVKKQTAASCAAMEKVTV